MCCGVMLLLLIICVSVCVDVCYIYIITVRDKVMSF